MNRLGSVTGVVGLAWAIAFAVMRLEWYFVALTVVFTIAAALFLAQSGGVAPKLPWLYVGAVAYVWLAMKAPVSLVGVGFSLMWGAVAFAGLLLVPLMIHSMPFGKPSPDHT